MGIFVNGVDITKQSIENVITKDNIVPYVPTDPYNPSTKKYVDDAIASVSVNVTTYTYIQNIPAATWIITHNLGRYPNVEIVDSAGSVVYGDIHYDSLNQITLAFGGAFAGTAYCN